MTDHLEQLIRELGEVNDALAACQAQAGGKIDKLTRELEQALKGRVDDAELHLADEQTCRNLENQLEQAAAREKELRAEVERLQERVQQLGVEECIWRLSSNPDDDIWDTSCGQAFVMLDESPSRCSYNFCPSCGGKLMEKV